MRRNVPNRTLLRKDPVIPGTHVNPEPNFCPIPPRGGPTQTLSEAESLIVRFQKLVKEMRAIRGKLYRLGIDPEKYA